LTKGKLEPAVGPLVDKQVMATHHERAGTHLIFALPPRRRSPNSLGKMSGTSLAPLLMFSGSVDLPRTQGFTMQSLGWAYRFFGFGHWVLKACFTRRARRKPSTLN
jgi:hypothetical protein